MDDDIKCDCSARGLKGIPRDCPGNTTQLIMTGNNLYLLDNDASWDIRRVCKVTNGFKMFH
jgi:hypothetical protein